MAAAALREEAPRPREYRADNAELRSEARGLAYRRSRRLEDRDPSGELVEWGAVVRGFAEGAWLRLADGRYLPFVVGVAAVLLPLEPESEQEEAAMDEADRSSLWPLEALAAVREPRPLDGALVEVFGMAGARAPTLTGAAGGERREVDADGQCGLCIGWLEEEQLCVVQTLEGLLVAVPEDNLRAWVHAPAEEEGGFDLLWMGGTPWEELFGASVCEALCNKGYCLIQTFFSAEDRELAQEGAEEGRTFRRMKQELESGYLGIDNNSKVAPLFPQQAGAEAATSSTAPAAVGTSRIVTSPEGPEAVLHAASQQMTSLGVLLEPWAPGSLGFSCQAVTSPMVRASIDRNEEEELLPESIQDDEDTSEWGGLVEAYIRFVQRRKLLILNMLHNEGGDLWLYPRGKGTSIHIPLSPGKLLVFRHDRMDYSYQVRGPSVALQAWVLDAALSPVKISSLQLSLGADGELGQVITNPGPAKADGPAASIMAISTRMSGEAWRPDHWWSIFITGTDCDVPWPATRWETEPYYEPGDSTLTGKAYTCHGGFMTHDQISRFDNEFFNIAADEARCMIPGQRLVMEVGYTCLFKAGFRRSDLKGTRIGAWLGDVGPDWNSFQTEWGRFLSGVSPEKLSTGMSSIVTAGRISHAFDMKGPVSTYDTACSSSLVALNAAHAAMFRRPDAGKAESSSSRSAVEDCSQALVGGVNTLLGPGSFIGNCMAGMLTRKGRCFTFTDSADGYQRADACGALFCQLLKGGTSDDDERLCALTGTCANADGKSASLTAPSGPAQQRLLRKSLDFGGVDPSAVSFAECHGTGTSLGDPIEVGAMQAVLCENREFPVLVGSHKSNTGHSEAGAGISGLTKCILYLGMQAAPPNCHFNVINPNISVEGYPMYFVSEAVDSGFSESACGVSSFGFGGSNARADAIGRALRGPREMLRVELPRLNVPREIPIGQPVYIRGSWDGWSEPHQLQGGRDGVYRCYLSVGETGWEEFQLSCDRRSGTSALIHPLVPRANQAEQIVGPDAQGRNMQFLVDAAAEGTGPGTVFQITFTWTEERKTINWRPMHGVPDGVVVINAHSRAEE